MTGSTRAARSPASGPRLPPSMIALIALRVTVTVAALVAVYYAMPLDHSTTVVAFSILLSGLAGFIVLVILQVRWIIRSSLPAVLAIEFLAVSIPFFLLLFAGTYVVLAALSVGNFGERLSHSDGLYFTVTVFSTVGFGDITAKSETARLVVTAQMVADLAVLGVAIRVVVGAVRHSQQRRRDAPQRSDTGP